eukprot:2394459-Prymnesium_polylepis.1
MPHHCERHAAAVSGGPTAHIEIVAGVHQELDVVRGEDALQRGGDVLDVLRVRLGRLLQRSTAPVTERDKPVTADCSAVAAGATSFLFAAVQFAVGESVVCGWLALHTRVGGLRGRANSRRKRKHMRTASSRRLRVFLVCVGRADVPPPWRIPRSAQGGARLISREVSVPLREQGAT